MSGYLNRRLTEVFGDLAEIAYGESPKMIANYSGFRKLLRRHEIRSESGEPDLDDLIEQLSNQLGTLIAVVNQILENKAERPHQHSDIPLSQELLDKYSHILIIYSNFVSEDNAHSAHGLLRQRNPKILKLAERYNLSELKDLLLLAEEYSNVLVYLWGIFLAGMNSEQSPQVQGTDEFNYQLFFELFCEGVFSELKFKWQECEGLTNQAKLVSEHWKSIILAELYAVDSLEGVDRLQRVVEEVFLQDNVVRKK